MTFERHVRQLHERVTRVRDDVQQFGDTFIETKTREFVLADARWLDDLDRMLLDWTGSPLTTNGQALLVASTEAMLAAIVENVQRKRAILEPIGPAATLAAAVVE